MLTSLHIKNIVLIEELFLEFKGGLSVLTGETGAGKSILLDSLGLVLGERAEANLLRRGAVQASVVAEFDLNVSHEIWNVLERQGFEVNSKHVLILRRTLAEDGRSKAFLNDQSISVGFLKTIGGMLVDVHGQFETYGLINPAIHRQLLDQFGHHDELLEKCGRAYSVWQASLNSLIEAQEFAARESENQDYYRDAVEELEKLSPENAEEELLIEQKRVIQNAAALNDFFNFTAEALGGEQGADLLISQVWRALERQSSNMGEGAQSNIREILDELDQAASLVQSASERIHSLSHEFEDCGVSLEDVEDRLYALRAAARKYRCTTDSLQQLLENFKQKLDLVDHKTERIKQLKAKLADDRKAYEACSSVLHDARLKTAEILDCNINAELKPLKLEKAIFKTSVVQSEHESAWTACGFDDIRFMVATNAHDKHPDFGQLNKIASGGEMARFMLSLKVVLAEQVPSGNVFVFDEIDTGIGGATASAVGDRLAKLATRHQVMVVTHSPQVAARAHHHWVVSKSTGQTQVNLLKDGDRREEIARMLAGAEITTEARAAAKKLLIVG